MPTFSADLGTEPFCKPGVIFMYSRIHKKLVQVPNTNVFFLQNLSIQIQILQKWFTLIEYLGTFIISLMMSTLQASGQARCDVLEYIRN